MEHYSFYDNRVYAGWNFDIRPQGMTARRFTNSFSNKATQKLMIAGKKTTAG